MGGLERPRYIMEEKKLFLLDAYALIYRAYYALLRSPRTTSFGMNTSAIFGFCNTLEDVLRKENPGYIAVCFDPLHGRTFRHDMYPEYKAGRDKQPEDISVAIPYIKSILAAYRIPVIEMEGYEADDIIGTLAHRAERDGFDTYMMTPDKDYGQLVTDHVFMYRPALKGQGFEIRGPQAVCERYGISSPRQVIDLLALEGDVSDNVPGCPGVGEKTAAKLIADYGSVENLLDNTTSLKGALQKKIVDNAGKIRMSKELVTIITDVPIDTTIESLRRREPDTEALVDIFKQLEFKSFIQKLTGPQPEAPAPKPELGNLFDFYEDEAPVAPVTVKSGFRELESLQDISSFLTSVSSAGTVGMALNVVGTEAMTAVCYGIAFAYLSDGKDDYVAGYIPFGDSENRSSVAGLLKPLFANTHVLVCGADIKRDMLVLRRMGVDFSGARWYDVSVAHYLCNPEQKHELSQLAMAYLGEKTYDYDLSSSERRAAPLDAVDAMCTSAVLCLRLKPLLDKEVAEKDHTALLNKMELPLLEVLASMEWEGVRIDVAELRKLSDELSARLDALQADAYELAGRPFNLSSPSQVGQILFDEMKIDPKARKTKGGSWSTAEDVLERYAKDVPLVSLILEIRGLRKLLTTYVDVLPRLINPRTGKLHTTYNQTVTATGRISSSNPNLQNIPVRTTDGREIRRAFIADSGDLLLSADYSQIELRLMAALSSDEGMVEAFLSGEDIHRSTAAKIYHKALDDVTDEQRRNAKTANFGIIYGISAFGLSERLGIPRAEAKNLIDGYMATYPGVAAYMKASVERAREKGYVSTTMGRRRYLPDINSRSNTVRSYAERNAINAPLQGSAADIIKIAMVNIHAEMRRLGLRSRMIMQVHDELIFNVKPDELELMRELVVRSMEQAYEGRVPMEVAAGVATNWLDAH